ncbi:hypothetical protein, partial [Rathayibacter tanaceti]|uniref:hypothetical protein n=1 Tax=Rathayibacter tanaceti TaxID=1671680 RepID=UPI000A5F57E4
WRLADAGRPVHDGPSSEWLGLAGRAFAAAAIALTAADSVLEAAARPVAVLLLLGVAVVGLRGGTLPPRAALLLAGLVVLLLAAAAVVLAVIPVERPVVEVRPEGGLLGAGTAAAFLLILFPVPRPGTVPALRPALLRIGVSALAAASLGTGVLLLAGPTVLAATSTPSDPVGEER